MKVLLLHSQCAEGGISRIAFSICDLLEKRGDKGVYAFSRGYVPKGRQSSCFQFGSKMGVYSHVLASRLFDSSGLHSLFSTKKLLRYIEKYEPDIIHLNNIHGYYLNYQVLFDELSRINIPIVWTLHDCWAFTGHCVHFEDVGCNKWKVGCGCCPQKTEYPKSVFLDRSKENYVRKQKALGLVDNLTICVPSNWLKDKVERSFLSGRKCIVINNGINLDAFTPRAALSSVGGADISGKRVAIAVASVWTAKKGYSDLAAIAKGLAESGCVLMVVGLTGAQKKELESLGNIIGIEHTSSIDELASLYSTADVFVNPTYEDTFPTVNIEALACGTPVVTYRTGGSPEIIDSECGLVVDVGDVSALVKSALMIKKDIEFCRNRARLFAQEDRFADYLAIYDSLLSGSTYGGKDE